MIINTFASDYYEKTNKNYFFISYLLKMRM